MSSNANNPPTVKAWDPLVRLFHWSLVFFFLLAFASGDDWTSLHVWAGYAVAMLVAFRLLWGIIGTRNARFLTFVKSPRAAMRHLGAMLSGKARDRKRVDVGIRNDAAVLVCPLVGPVGNAEQDADIDEADQGDRPSLQEHRRPPSTRCAVALCLSDAAKAATQ